MKTISIEDVKDDYRRGPGHWFSKDTMRFFASRVMEDAFDDENGHVYFVSSEQFRYMGRVDARRYSVRCYTREGRDITTVGEFQAYATRKSALAAAERLARHGAPVGV